MTTQLEVNFSELINKPKATLAGLAGAKRILLRRRDAEDLVITTAARVEQDAQIMSAGTRMFVALVRHDTAARSLLLEIIPEAFPWVRFLPEKSVRAFAAELAEVLPAAESLGNMSAVATTIAAWQHTAEVHSDPELLAALTTDRGEDYGPVPEPGVTG
ncbi:hypothetical protein AB0I22_23995 [Streptomyces sp. NPDC050610]|uniref:hypothetical protein n=1 Tax=Streptomyces sp. NPDC050610 TaxID=3157097 RepID=UPI0034230F57